MLTALKIFIGAGIGFAAGYVLGGTKTCSGEYCNIRARRWAMALSGAVLGAAAAWNLARV